MRPSGLTAPEPIPQAIVRQPQRAPDGAPVHCEGRRPEQTTLYRLVQQHAASFIAHTEASTGAELPRIIKDEFEVSFGSIAVDGLELARHPNSV